MASSRRRHAQGSAADPRAVVATVGAVVHRAAEAVVMTEPVAVASIRPDAWFDWLYVQSEDWNGQPILKLRQSDYSSVHLTKRTAAELIAELSKWVAA